MCWVLVQNIGMNFALIKAQWPLGPTSNEPNPPSKWKLLQKWHISKHLVFSAYLWQFAQIILWRLGSKFKIVWPIDQMMVESFLISTRAKLTEWENGEIGYDATPLTFRVNVTTDKRYQRAARDETKEFEMCAFWCIAWNITIVPFSKENILGFPSGNVSWKKKFVSGK